jgi:heterodisulfide reductase subunit A-like polyferredoxin
MAERIGVYICHCGTNIAGKVRVDEVTEYAAGLPNVVVARDYLFMCSDPGQELIEKDIPEYGLTRVVVASCSPRMHEGTFRDATERGGLNPFRAFHMICIREHDSWVTEDEDDATEKAKDLVRGAVNRVRFQVPLITAEFDANPDVLIVGGGISGMQAALDVAKSGNTAYLVEKQPTIGGHMLQFDKTFPTLDCASCIGTPKMVAVGQNKNIKLLTYSEVEEISGFIGNYKVKVRRHARYVDENTCTGCGECTKVCPVIRLNEWDENLQERKAVYRSFPQAVPITFVIEKKDRAPCVQKCPANTNVQGYVALISQGKYQEALELIMEDLPLPGTLGRICPAPCEKVCRRKEIDEALAIRELKRFAYDHADLTKLKPPLRSMKKEKAAIIGSGPAGLSAAYHLARKGYKSTIFEAMPAAGGMLRYGVPDNRLPKHILDEEIDFIKSLGVEIKLENTIDNIDRLMKQGFDAVFIGIGGRRKKSVELGIPGPGFLEGVDGINMTEKGAIEVDPITYAAGKKGVFAGGDLCTGPGRAIDSVAAGKEAAVSIDRFFAGEDMAEGRQKPEKMLDDWAEIPEDIEKAYRPEIPKVKKGSKEESPGLSEQDAQAEASRCISCGVCSECMACVDVCQAKCIHHDMKDEIQEIEVGSIILTTGYDLFDPAPMKQFGYGKFPNVIHSLEFERYLNATGPTSGKVFLRDENFKFTDKMPESVAILHCIGSRDENYHEYCSRVCCMYALKFAHLIKDRVGKETAIFNFYIDMRCFGKGHEEFMKRVQGEGVRLIRGKAAKVTDEAIYDEEKGKLMVIAEDTISAKLMRIPVDMVILCSAIQARADAEETARIFGVSMSGDGFFLEEHPKLEPVSTATSGVFIAGCCQGPKDITDSVAQAKGAAAECLALGARGKVAVSPMISYIDPNICIGCKQCIDLCAYGAIEFDERHGISVVNEAVCKGCGSCSAHCPSGAAKVKHFTDKQIFAEIDGLLANMPWQ